MVEDTICNQYKYTPAKCKSGSKDITTSSDILGLYIALLKLEMQSSRLLSFLIGNRNVMIGPEHR